MKDILREYVLSSFRLLQNYEKKGRYFHELKKEDNSPLVIHRNTNQLTYVLEGTGKAYLNGEEQILKEGMALLIEAGTAHRFTADTTLCLFHIHIPDEGRDMDREVIEGDDYNRYKPE